MEKHSNKIEKWEDPAAVAHLGAETDVAPISIAPVVTASPLEAAAESVVVFVHGIFSSHETFARFYSELKSPTRALFYFDYQYQNKLEDNGRLLAEELKEKFGGLSKNVTLICHSMGGIVGRLAILSSSLPCVKTIFLLGTPNLGAFSTAQLGILGQLLRGGAGVVTGTFLRAPGIADLTRVNDILTKYKKGVDNNSSGVDYISIPGCYFHEDRDFYDISGPNKVGTTLFATLDAGFSVFNALMPLFKISLRRPHDGIVEDKSNCLFPGGPGRWSEKSTSFVVGKSPSSYYHIQLNVCDELTHVTLHKNEEVIRLVKSIMEFPSAAEWRASYDGKPPAAAIKPNASLD